MKRVEPRTIGDLINDMIARTGMTAAICRHNVENAWPAVAGAAIAAYTSHVIVRERTLHVYITSAPLKEQLGYVREALVEKLNAAAGAEVINNIAIH